MINPKNMNTPHLIRRFTTNARTAAFLALATASAASANYSSGFEGVEYVLNNSISGTTDNTVGSAWVVQTSGSDAIRDANLDVTTSGTNPASGAKHLLLVDTKSQGAITARLNMSSVMPKDDIFTLSFKIAPTLTGSGGIAGSLLFGDSGGFYDGGKNYWTRIGISGADAGASANTLTLYYKASLASATTTFTLKNANGTNFSYTAGAYLDFSLTFDATGKKYSSIKLNGIEQLGLSGNPSIAYVLTTAAATPGSEFQFFTTTNYTSTGTIALDTLSLSGGAQIPESACVALITGVGILLLAVAAKRIRG